MKHRRLLAGWISLAVIAGAIIATAYWWVGTPRYSLWMIRRAYNHRDFQQFNTYFDVESAATRAADGFIDSIERERNTPGSNSEPGPSPSEKRYWHERVRTEELQSYRAAFEESSGARAALDWLGNFSVQSVRVANSEALVEVESHGGATKSSLKLRMVRLPNRRWRVTEIVDSHWDLDVVWH